jgi:hypothetical protein
VFGIPAFQRRHHRVQHDQQPSGKGKAEMAAKEVAFQLASDHGAGAMDEHFACNESIILSGWFKDPVMSVLSETST